MNIFQDTKWLKKHKSCISLLPCPTGKSLVLASYVSFLYAIKRHICIYLPLSFANAASSRSTLFCTLLFLLHSASPDPSISLVLNLVFITSENTTLPRYHNDLSGLPMVDTQVLPKLLLLQEAYVLKLPSKAWRKHIRNSINCELSNHPHKLAPLKATILI